MEVTLQENSTGPLSRLFVRDGVAGNHEIIFEMIRMIRNSVNYDLGLKKLTADLLVNKKLDSYSPAEKQLNAIYVFVKSNVKYIQDQAGLIESIKSARVTLADGYGDCDDLTNTVAAMVGCIGFEDVKIAMAKYLPTDTSFVHVYPVVYVDGKRFVMDATLPNGELGAEVKSSEVKEISIFADVEGLDGVSGLFNNIKYNSKKVGKAVIEGMPIAADFLPLGFISGQAFATGARMINASTTKELSINAVGSKINGELDKIIIDLMNSRTSIDLAQSQAAQIAAQLSTIKNGRDNPEIYEAVKESIAYRVRFINNFEAVAALNGIPVVRLNPAAMLTTGLVGAGIGGYILYKVWKERKQVF